jgi:hypothetical protein
VASSVGDGVTAVIAADHYISANFTDVIGLDAEPAESTAG